MNGKIELTIPENWKEVTREQLGVIAAVMNEKLTREETLMVMFCRFTGLKSEGNRVFVTQDGKRIIMEPWQMADFCGRLSFIMDELPNDIVNPTGVNSYLDDITFGKYFHADALMYAYKMSDDPKLVRKALNDLGERGWYMSKQHANEVALWWAGVQQWLKGQYPLVYEGEGEGEEYDPLKARQNIMLMLNDNKPQDNQSIEDSNMHDVLSSLQQKIELAKRLEEQMKSRKS